MEYIKAIIMGVVEGVTEFLPVSSTGHLILTKDLLNFQINDSFEVFIQIGAILAVLLEYRRRFWGLLDFKQHSGFHGLRGILLLGLTSVPALGLGYIAHGYIKSHLFNSFTVAVGLAVGALWILLAEHWMKAPRESDLDQITWKQALGIGCFQCLALWPGMSRSSSTILGAMLLGISRKTAAEYSFFAAVPVLMVAGVFDLVDSLPSLQAGDMPLYAVGLVVSFFAAWMAIRFFIRFIQTHTLIPFGWYRLAVAGAILACLR